MNVVNKLLTLTLLIVTMFGTRAAEPEEFQTSLECFLARHTGLVKGKRVGLVTNQTGVDRKLNSVIDVFHNDPRIDLVALFAPEHGIRGDVPAGETVNAKPDFRTGIPVYSLYGGRDHRPTKEQLDKIDVLIYFIQDVGCRSYTYIWHLLECMSACAEANKPVIVLDVPNIWGLETVDGPMLESKYKSFIGLYPIPYIYGMTPGELARYLNRTEYIGCKLYIVPMRGLRRDMCMMQLPLPWVPTSPQVPSMAAACGYGAVGPIGTLGAFNIGINGTLPFQVVAAPGLDGGRMSEYLNRRGLSGVRFRPISFVPTAPPYAGKRISGVQLHFTNPAKVHPTELTVHILCYLRDNYRNFSLEDSDRLAGEGFDRAMGTAKLRKDIASGKSAEQIVLSYRRQLEEFKARRAPFLIYK